MADDVEDVKRIRKKLGITQKQLSERAGVSQSLIAKLESGKVDPTYTKMKKILETLSQLERKDDIKAEQIMNTRIVSIEEYSQISEAIFKMKKFNISQLPVIEGNNAIGLISESTILEAMLNSKAKRVKDVMQEPPPIVSKKASIQVVSNLLKHYPMVLVSHGGKLVGLISKSDLIGVLYR